MEGLFHRPACLALAAIAAATLAAASPTQTHAPFAPILVTYGHENHPREGDPDFSQILYLSVPETMTERFVLRIFDPDTEGAHDLQYNRLGDSETRFSVYGGAGAYRPRAARQLDRELAGGQLLVEQVYDADPDTDGTWQNIAELDPQDGDLVDGRRIFRLLVDGFDGDDANVFSVTAGTLDDEDRRPEGFELFSFRPTFRVPVHTVVLELTLRIPENAGGLVIHNFDSFGAKMELDLPQRSVPLSGSGDNVWESDEIELRDDERDGPAAIVISGGREWPNDLALYATDDSEQPIALALPPILWATRNLPPVAVISPPQHAGGGQFHFDGTKSRDPDGTLAHHRWDFGDGNISTEPAPGHVYTAPGTYEVELTVQDDSGRIRDTASATTTLVVNAPPIADAGRDIVAAPGEEVVLRGDRSLDPDGAIVEHQWELGDGATSTGAVVTHRYQQPGTYLARLSVRDDSGDDDAIDFAETTVRINQAPHADAGPDVLAAPGEAVRFDAGESFDPDGEIVEFRWDFSDTGTPRTGRTGKRSFDAPGVYTAQLTITDDSGASNATARGEARIRINHSPEARAGADVHTAERTVPFDGSASADADGDPLSFHWDFGDGQSAQGAVVSHTYAAGGSYPVVLVVSDGTGLNGSRHRDALTVHINQPPVAVAGEDHNVCTGDVVVFDGSNSSDPDGGVLRYFWDFGDGSTARIVNPTKVYDAAGNHSVTLTVTDDSGLENGEHADRLSVRVHQSPVANAGNDVLACANTPVQFDGTRSTDPGGAVNRFSWDFGDGNSGGGEQPSHVYTRPGSYRAVLTIEGSQAGQCSNVASDEIDVEIIAAPTPVIDAVETTPVSATTRFDGSGSILDGGNIIDWRWDFGDGTTSDEAVAEHRFEQPGIYRVSLTVSGDTEIDDCRAVSTHRFIKVNAPPIAVAGDDRAVRVGEEALFDGAASHDPDGGLTEFTWDFGDGTTARGMQARHTYREAGTYDVALTVSDDAGIANREAADTLRVTVTAPPELDIDGPDMACAGETVAWTINGEDAPLPATWLLGDGKSATGGAVTHQYGRPGRYPVTAVVDGGSGRRTTTRNLRINAPPRALAGRDRRACPAETLSFDASGSRDADGEIARWAWDFGDGNTAQGKTVEHAYAEPGRYRATLTVTDDSGSACDTATDSVEVIVDPPPAADAGADQEVWIGGAGDALLLDGSASRHPEGGALHYSWELPDGTVLAGRRVRHVLTRAGAFDVRLSVDDLSGRACAVASDTVKITARTRRASRDDADAAQSAQ